MVLPRDIRHRIERGDFDAVELAWLEHLETDPEDIDHFVGIARALVGAGQSELGRTLLDLLDEELGTHGQEPLRLELLRSAGPIMVPKGKFHSAVLAILRNLHGANSSLEGLIEILKLDRVHKDPAQTWDRVARLESLLMYTKETVVWVDGHGPGSVAEVNYELESFKIKLESGIHMRVGFRAAPKLLDALADDHFLVRKRNDFESFAQLKPAEILEQVLTSFDRPMTGAEIRHAVQGLVDRARWNGWWTSAKKHPQVVASTEIRNAYTWADSTAEASDALWSRFKKGNPKAKLELLRKASTQDADLIEKMTASLKTLADEYRRSQPGLVFEINSALERVARTPGAQEELVRDADWRLLIENVQSRQLKQRAYDLARTARSDWLEIFGDGLLRETDPALINHLANALLETSPETYNSRLAKAMAQPVAAPALFTWIAERASHDEELRARFGKRLLKKILDAPSREAFKLYRRRLVELCESGGTLPKLLAHVSADDAQEVLESIRRTRFSTDQRQGLQDALVLKFPNLEETEEPLWALAGSIEIKREELKQLLEEEIPTNRRAIETARELGDLRENFEYKSARQRHEYLTARAEQLARDLGRSRPVDLDSVDCSRVRVGTRVRLESADGAAQVITILGPWESAPEEGILSYLSDVAQTLLGHSPGDQVDLAEGAVRVADIIPANDSETLLALQMKD